MTTLFRKWWIILLQGILLIIISFIFFNNPAEVLAVISFWVGLLTLIDRHHGSCRLFHDGQG